MASSIANSLSMVSYRCSVHGDCSCSVLPVVGRESSLDMKMNQVTAASSDDLQVMYDSTTTLPT
jgi:hypothetical protein